MATRIKYEDVKQDVESKGWTLVSDSYKNLKTDLELICPNNHQVFVPYEDWRKYENYECPICIKQNIVKINEKTKRKKEGRRILALDQSTRISGWSIYEDSQLINYGHWEATENQVDARISSTLAWVASMIDKHQIDQVYFEDIQLQKFDNGEAVTTYKVLAQLQGVLFNYCYENGIPYEEIFPATWRQYNNVKGKTRTDRKKSAQLKVKSIFDIDVSEDEADSILIGRYASSKTKATKMIKF